MAAHDYFDWLALHADSLLSLSLRSDAEIDDNSPSGTNAFVDYDATEDAAMVTLLTNEAGVGNAGQCRCGLDGGGYESQGTNVSTGNLLLTWDVKWGDGYKTWGSEGVETHKMFQLSEIGAGDDRRLEIRARYSLSDSSYVAEVDCRSYKSLLGTHNGDEQPMGRDGCVGNPGWPDTDDCQDNGFSLQSSTWTRYWAFLDFDNDEYSMWVADENTSPVKLFDEFPITFITGINNFWFEWATSQNRTGGSTIYAWYRNLSALQDVTNVQSIVDQGAFDASFGAATETLHQMNSPLRW